MVATTTAASRPATSVAVTIVTVAGGIGLLPTDHPTAAYGVDRVPDRPTALRLEGSTTDLAKQQLQNMEEQIRTELRRRDNRIAIGDISSQGGRLRCGRTP